MRRVILAVLVTLAAACNPHSKLPQGAQSYLIVKVLNSDNKLVVAGTIAPAITFDYSGDSPDREDGFSFHGSLVENTSSGFRIHWQAEQHVGVRQGRSIDKEEFAPWGAETSLESLSGYHVNVFYASKPANEYFTLEDLTK
jgi:hypothetical protein